MKNVAIFGANGAIGSEFVRQFLSDKKTNKIFAFSRRLINHADDKITYINCDITDENSVYHASKKIDDELDIIVFAAGVLHIENKMPEKAISHISKEYMQKVFEINTIAPALVMKEFLPLLRKGKKTIFIVISARVGSISDNYLGGWYSYRASKSALNMLLKSVSIEMKRKNKDSVVIGLHPGTVSSDLSKPFQSNIKPEKLFTPKYSVTQMMGVISDLIAKDSGKIFAYDGQVIQP